VARTLAGTTLALSLIVGSCASLEGAVGPQPNPDRCDATQQDRPRRCVGPVVDESGGGGDTLTIVVSVVVGLAVAGIAFVLLRHHLEQGTRG
jgi:hypothetical protein